MMAICFMVSVALLVIGADIERNMGEVGFCSKYILPITALSGMGMMLGVLLGSGL